MAGPVGMLWAIGRLLARAPAWLRLPRGSAAARTRARDGLASFARDCGLDVRAIGRAETGGTLFVANHVSWADVVAIGSLCDAAFVARADLARWPVIGLLARHRETIFVARTRRGESARQVDLLRAALASGRDVVLFAEGTTSDGSCVLPFRTALLAAADAASRIQPLAIGYLEASGAPLTAERRRKVAWIGDDGAGAVLRAFEDGPVAAVIHFLPALMPGHRQNRKILAAACHEAVRKAHLQWQGSSSPNAQEV